MTHTAAPLSARPVSVDQALALFDQLDPVSVDFMLGRWRGEGVNTGHPMDGLLEHYGWHGKHFHSADQVDPLVFNEQRRMPPRVLFPGLKLNDKLIRSKAMPSVFRLLSPLLESNQCAARLRRTEYRGKITATMIYDHLPINDVCARIDDNTVLGVMDQKGVEQPFIFILHREVPASSLGTG